MSPVSSICANVQLGSASHVAVHSSSVETAKGDANPSKLHEVSKLTVYTLEGGAFEGIGEWVGGGEIAQVLYSVSPEYS